MAGISESTGERPPMQEAPVVLWHQLADPHLYGKFDENTRLAALAQHCAYWEGVDSIMKAAIYAADLPIYPNRSLERNFGPEQPDRGKWIAYTCREGTDPAALMRFNYGVWMGVYGQNGLADRLDNRVWHLLGKITTIDEKILPRPRQQGRLVFPDVVNGVLPGTYWLPDRKRLDVPAWPRMPTPEEAATERRKMT